MGIEDVAQRFVALAGKAILSKAEHQEACNLMRQLKGQGMTNEDVAELSHGRWTPSTVKGYVKGVKASSSGEWQSALTLFDKLLAVGMSLGDVERALAVQQAVDDSHVNLEQLVDLLLTAESAAVDKAALIHFYEGVKQRGLSVEDVAQVLSFKAELDQKGVGSESIKSIVELAKKHGKPQDILAAVCHYGSLTEIKQQITTATKERDNLNAELASARDELEVVKGKASQLKGMLRACHEAKRLGFTEAVLAKIGGLVEKYGSVGAVVQMAEACASHLEVTQKVEQAKTELVTRKARLEKLQADYAHLKSSVDMCRTLIEKHRFGLDAITMVFSAAEKYGEPLEVLKALEAQGQLEVIEEKLSVLEGKISEQEKLLAELHGRRDEMLEELESLNAVALRVGGEISKLQIEVSKSKTLDALMRFIQEPNSVGYEEGIPLVVTITAALRKWVINNESKCHLSYTVKDGLNNLLRQFGGD